MSEEQDPKPEITDDEAYDAAFAEIEEPEQPAAEPEAPEPEDSEDTASDESPDEDAEEPEPEPDTPDWQARFEKLEQRTKSWEGRLSAADRENQRLKAELERFQQPEEPDEDDSDTLDPDVSSAKRDYPDIDKLIDYEVTKRLNAYDQQVGKRLDPIAEQTAEQGRQAHLAQLDKAHPEWRQWAESGELQNWVGEQPDYLRPSLEQVMQQGDADQVIGLLDHFDAARQAKSRAAQGKQRARQAADAAAVKSHSSGPPVGRPDKNDFDGAWDESD
jgi:hypothetical protein